ncbi:unnamed protein product, partial [Sphagnum balticum]
MGLCGWLLAFMSWMIVVLTFPFSICFCLKVVQEYERAVIFRLGRLLGGGAKGPGIFFVLPCIESYSKVDLRTLSFDVPPQEILTKDSVTTSVDAVVYYRVSNATVSVANVENAHHSTRLLAQTTLRNILGMRNLSEILSDREAIATSMQVLGVDWHLCKPEIIKTQEVLDDATTSWGIKVERVEVKDVRLPVQLQRAMAAEAEATREARARVIAAEGEQKASWALKQAAETISSSPDTSSGYAAWICQTGSPQVWAALIRRLLTAAKAGNRSLGSRAGVGRADVVKSYERVIVFRLGRLMVGSERATGLIIILPCIDTYNKIDIRTVTFDVPPQEILSKDSVTVSVEAAVYYRVSNAVRSVVNAENAQHSTRLLAQTTLRNTLGMRSLSAILSERDSIAHTMQGILDEATEVWGIKVERVEIKDVRLPVSLQRSMAAEAEATREARAHCIVAEGELRSARTLRDAADIVATSPGALQLRYLQTLSSIANEKNSTIIFPMPVGGLGQ